MKKKILGMIMCMMLLVTAFPTVQSIKNSAISTTIPNTYYSNMETSWNEMQKLLDSEGTLNDFFGFSVSLDGNTALIGAMQDDDNGVYSGSAFVFIRTGTIWTLQQKLLASDGATNDYFGYSVSLSGDTALISAAYDDDNGAESGSAYVFSRNGTTWMQQAKLLASDGVADEVFGISVSLNRDTALIGSLGNDNGTGSVYVFTHNGTTWTPQAKLLASDGAVEDNFGESVSLNGDVALIGAVQDDDNGANSGSAYVFTRNGTNWTQQQKLLALDGAANDWFGGSVSLDGDTALIGAIGDDDNGANSGSAYIFTKESGTPDLKFNITGGLGVNLKITNNGTTNANEIAWKIQVRGGILGKINKIIDGTVDIQAGGSKTVGTGLFFGLGPIAITAKVADVEKTAEGTQFFILTMTKK